jgi:N-acyl-D-amino-acid deacylase
VNIVGIKCLLILLLPLLAGFQPRTYDIVLRGGRIVDGTGAPWYQADVALADGRIAAIGRLQGASARRELDVRGFVIAPGFIDLMGQTVAPLLDNPGAALNLLSQGITTINAGEGGSDAPLDGEAARKAGWRTMAEFFARVEKIGIPLNFAQTVGHTQLRRIAVGLEDRRASAAELARMKELAREAMEAGAIGLSTSLIYPPAVYAPEEEIVELARVAGAYGGRYYTHMRNEGDRLLEAIDEALRIGEQAGTPVHIYHIKTAGRANWGKMEQALARIRAARAAGREVAADVYPYINNGLGIRAMLHPRHSARGPAELVRALSDPSAQAEMRRDLEEDRAWENWYQHVGRDWDRVVVGSIEDARYARHNGRSIAEIARVENTDPWEVFFALCRAGAFAMPQSMSEANKIRAMREPFVAFDTDAGPDGGGRSSAASHPRSHGAFPRVLARYVRELGVLSLEEAIHKMTALAANEILARDRGRLAPGLAADLVVFSAERVRDRATFAEPALLSEGIEYVLVNGTVVFQNGRYTGARPGRVLRRP